MQENEKICLHCGEVFIPNRSDAQYCSPSCKQLAYLERKEGKMEESELVQEEIAVKNTEELPVKNSSLSATITDKQPKDKQEGGRQLNHKEQGKQEKKEEAGEETIEEYKERKIWEHKLRKAMGEDMVSRLKKWWGHDKECAQRMNTRLKEWLLAIKEFHRKTGIVEKVKELIKAMTKYEDDFYFKYLPADYPYRDFIMELKEKLRLWMLEVEMNNIDEPMFILPKKRRVDFTYILLDIDV